MVNSKAVRANLLDASVLVKNFVKEKGSNILEKYLRNETILYTTPFCFYEALNVLKMKWLRKEICKQDYLSNSFSIIGWFLQTSHGIKDIDLFSPTVLGEVKKIVDRYQLDLSDALQIISVKYGRFSKLVVDSRTVLITADKRLAEVAKDECILSWYVMEGSPP